MRLGFVQFTAPLEPTEGVVHDQPAGADNDTKAIFPGSESFNPTLSAVSGPALVIVIV